MLVLQRYLFMTCKYIARDDKSISYLMSIRLLHSTLDNSIVILFLYPYYKVGLQIECSIVKMTDVLRTWYNDRIRSEYLLRSKFLKKYRVAYRIHFHMIGLKYLQCCCFKIPFYHINCLATKSQPLLTSRLNIRCLLSPC